MIWESASFSVTAAPEALPAQVSSFSTSNVTTTTLTLNWPAVSGATGYKVLARTGPGSKWGTLANTTVSSPSYAFTGLTAGGEVVAIVSAISANGQGDEESAAREVESAWRDYLPDAVAVLKTLREPDQAMAAVGDPAALQA